MNPKSRQDDEGSSRPTSGSTVAGDRHIAMVDHRIDSSELFVTNREITIVHGADHYRLRLTAQNKLILTK
jgi:hemin uptake protein HemP